MIEQLPRHLVCPDCGFHCVLFEFFGEDGVPIEFHVRDVELPTCPCHAHPQTKMAEPSLGHGLAVTIGALHRALPEYVWVRFPDEQPDRHFTQGLALVRPSIIRAIDAPGILVRAILVDHIGAYWVSSN